MHDATNDGCPSGTYQGDAAPGELAVCMTIPPGYELSSSSIVQCVSGYYKSAPGAGSCAQCSTNFACAFPDSAPVACTTGYESTAGSTSCTKKNTAIGGTCTGKFAYPNSNECLACPKGFECPTAFAAPLPCTLGWYADAED